MTLTPENLTEIYNRPVVYNNQVVISQDERDQLIETSRSYHATIGAAVYAKTPEAKKLVATVPETPKEESGTGIGRTSHAAFDSGRDKAKKAARDAKRAEDKAARKPKE